MKVKRDFSEEFGVLAEAVKIIFTWLWLMLSGFVRFVFDLSDKVFGEKKKKKGGEK